MSTGRRVQVPSGVNRVLPAPRHLLPGLLAGMVVGLSAVVTGIGVAALAFPGPLQPHLFTAVGHVLFGAMLMLVVVGLASSFRGAVCLPQEAPAAILGLLALSLYGTLSGRLEGDALVAVIVAAIALCTAVTGIGFLLLGHFRLGGLIRFIPYPVVGGVLAGLGWLMVQGGVSVLTGDFLSLAGMDRLLDAGPQQKLAAGALVAILLFLGTARFRHFLTLPLTLLAAVVLFHLAAAALGSPAQAMDGGWLLGPFPEGIPWRPVSLQALAGMDWRALAAEIPTVGTLILVSSISILLYASGIELELRQELDLDRELKAAGTANLLVALVGGVPGFHSMSDSILAREMHALQRATALFAAVFIGLCLFAGFELLAWMPRPVLGGLLLFLGLGLLWEWTVRARRSLPVGDWSIVLLILVVSAWVGYLEAIGVGLVAGIILFVVNYSRVRPTRHLLSAALMHSNVDRAPAEAEVLERHGESIQVLVLQGFLFFGTANNVLEQLRERVREREADVDPVRFVVLDFRRVTGLDSSAVLVFRKLLQLAEERDIVLVLSDLDAEAERMFAASGLLETPALRAAPDLDHGLEWCEERLLAELGPAVADEFAGTDELSRLLASEDFTAWLQSLEVEAGEVVIRAGDPADGLYLLREGRVTVRLREDDTRRLRTFGPGTVIGEIAMYLGGTRSATVVADTPARIDRLGRDELARMLRERPELAAVFHEAMATLVCERLAHGNRLLAALD